MSVSVLLVSHNGARWLPAVVAGVARQTAPIAHHVAIDTGSRDDSVRLVRENGIWDAAKVEATTSYPEAVRLGLERLPRAADPAAEWIWLLHDDSAPAPDALEQLLAAAAEHPSVHVFGPKLREWPSLRRLLEMGVSISGNGRRETGLERGEYDQGQHDQRRVVLAVNTAGMLVRRDVLGELGLDPLLGLYGNDLDFGWRAARAGHPTMVVPEAVVFHVEAAARSLRRGTLARHHHRDARYSAIRTLLVNGSAAGLPLRAVRLLVGGLIRAIGFLLIRAPREAGGELVALGGTLGRPLRLLKERRSRKQAAVVPSSDVRHLLAPPWLPVRHLLDGAADFGSAATDLLREQVGGRSVRTAHTVDVDDSDEAVEPGLLALLARDSRTWLVVASLLLGLVAARDLLGGGGLVSPVLANAPDGVGTWWSAWSHGNHLIGIGSDVPAPPYVLPLALLSTLALGNPGWVVGAILVIGVPLAFLSAVRFLRAVAPGRWSPLAGGAAYALVPVVGGAVAQGRLGTVAAAIVLPWVARSALGLRRAEADPRWRAVWRTTIGLALLVAFAPALWAVAVLLLVVLLGHGLATDRARWKAPTWWAAPVVIAVAPAALTLPWFVGALGNPGRLLLEAGRAGALQVDPGPLGLLLGRIGGPGSAPAWLGAGLLLAGLVALVRDDTRPRVALAWLVAGAGALGVLLCATAQVRLPGLTDGVRPYAGGPLLVAQGAVVTAVTLAGAGLRAKVGPLRAGWRPAVAAVGLVGLGLSVAGGLGWWLTTGAADPLHRGRDAEVPAYMSELASTDPANGVLVLRGDLSTGVGYQVLRRGPLRLGEDAIAAGTAPDARLTTLLQRLLADPQPKDARALASYGVSYVYLPAPASAKVAGAFDSGAGFSRASGTGTDDAAWRLQFSPDLASTRTAGQPRHLLWVLLQALAVLAAIVLAMPTRRVVG